jgi:UrcA family protein
MKKTLIAAQTLLLMASPGHGAPKPVDVRSATVAYADLDLGVAEGRATLEGRLRAAARRVCSDPGGGPMTELAVSRCRQAAMVKGRNAAVFAVARSNGLVRLAARP